MLGMCTSDDHGTTCKKIVMPEMFYPASMHFKLLESGFRPEPCRNDKFSDFCKRLYRIPFGRCLIPSADRSVPDEHGPFFRRKTGAVEGRLTGSVRSLPDYLLSMNPPVRHPLPDSFSATPPRLFTLFKTVILNHYRHRPYR
jgi:hypothetical protein